ncbi:MAG: OmpA family protein [Bacteroidales bacterium]
MIDIKKFYLYFILLIVPIGLKAQDTAFINKLWIYKLNTFGNNALKQSDYSTAACCFERYVKLQPENENGYFCLGESYKYLRDYKKAEEAYFKAYEKSGQKNLEALYNHALMLKMNGDYKEAKKKFSEVLNELKKSKKYQELKKNVKAELSACDSTFKWVDSPKKILISHLDTNINKIYFEHSPVSINDSTFIYTSLRTNKKEYIYDNDTANIPLKKFYKAFWNKDKWVFEGEFNDIPVNKEGYNISNGAFSPDGKRFYFTRCKINWQNKIICAIYVSKIDEEGKWSEPVMLDEKINNPKYTSTMPTVGTESQKGNDVLYFISDNPKGKGKFDIWYSVYDKVKKTYSVPHNAGSKINTKENELSPYYDNETHTLYFSSDGLPGIGGMDVFRSIGDLNKYSPPENVGLPINSSADDIYYSESKNRENGFIVSNRKGGTFLKNETCCDDIYSFKRIEYINLDLKGIVKEKQDSISNFVKLIDSANISIYIKGNNNSENILIKNLTSNKNGSFSTKLETNYEYIFIISKDGYFNNKFELTTKNCNISQTFKKEVELTPIPEKPIIIKNIYYDFDEAKFISSSTSVIDTTILTLLNENPDLIVEISSHTDSKGSYKYNMTLSQRRAESVVNYLTSKGISKDRLIAKGYGESKPIAPNETPDGKDYPEGREKNRRTEFRVIGKLKNDKEPVIEYKE